MQAKSVWVKVGRLFFLLVVTGLIGYLGRIYMTPDTLDWYQSLPKAPLTPPDYMFGFVWSGLFLLMSISAVLVWGKVSLKWFVFQLIANMLWSFCFFFLHSPLVAVFVLCFMLFCILECIKEFYRYSKVSGLLFIPLFLWSLFALYLNTIIVIQNIDKI